MDTELIPLDKGTKRIQEEGIRPFLICIDKQEREFFKAKEFISLYDLIFKMCIQRDQYNWTEPMYELYTNSITCYLRDTVSFALNQARQQSGAVFLKEWKTRWLNQKLVVTGLSKVFMYLDRFYTPNADKVPSLVDQGYSLYKKNIYDEFAPHARTTILNLIEKERNNEEQDTSLLKEAVSVFVEMGYFHGTKKLQIYESDLQQHIVSHAGVYYQRKSRQWMDQDSMQVYLINAEKMLQAERTRVETYLNRATLEPLQKECYTQLLKVHQKELLKKKTGLNHLLTINATEDLSRLYRLYKGNEADLEPIAELFLEHVKKAGIEVVDNAKAAAAGSTTTAASGNEEKSDKAAANNPDANHALVQQLITLHAQYNQVVVTCFERAQIMQKSLKKAFEEFINTDHRVSKLLAKFVNDVLKKGSKLNVKDIESTLDNVVFLYGYIQEKDIFERDYQSYLAKRLLSGSCESEHSEKSMIAKLKAECGYQWTNKLEGMFKDVQLSKDLMKDFREMYESDKNDSLDISLEVNVCTTGYWPQSKAIPCKMPEDLANACDKYKRFYLHRHTGHKLEWRYDQGQAEVLVDFNETTKKALVCSTYQMMILLVFNSIKRPTYRQIQDLTSIPRNDCAQHLISLAHPKVNVLLKRPNGPKLDDTHQFMINPSYQNALKKISIPVLKTGIEMDENPEVENKLVELQRQHQMDASIVRIMKTRKTLRHNLLVAEVMNQLQARFKPKTNDIKKRIEALIEQEYMERDANDRSTYQYKA